MSTHISGGKRRDLICAPLHQHLVFSLNIPFMKTHTIENNLSCHTEQAISQPEKEPFLIDFMSNRLFGERL